MPGGESGRAIDRSVRVMHRDIIVIGASAGGVEALQEVVGSFPADLPAAVFVVVHMFPRSRSLLPEILSAAGPLSACHPKDGELIQPGRIYVAPPDHHLKLALDHIHLGTGPKEQHQRPSINVTFRSAALAFAARVIGVVLTGQLDDGTAGLWDIKQRGGVAVVQNPEDASFPSMPLSALREVDADYTPRLAEMGSLLAKLTRDGLTESSGNRREKDMEREITDLTCPDCKGTIWRLQRGGTVEYQCRVGHAYSPQSMLAEHFATQERLLWSGVVALEEGASLASQLAATAGPNLREPLEGEAKQRLEEAAALRQLIERRKSFSIE